VVNLKKVRRIHAEDRPQVKCRKGCKKASGTRAPLVIPQTPDQRWSIVFMSDVFAFVRSFRVLAIIDDFSAEYLSLVADTSISAIQVGRELDRLITAR
jgi:putative transposase